MNKTQNPNQFNASSEEKKGGWPQIPDETKSKFIKSQLA